MRSLLVLPHEGRSLALSPQGFLLMLLCGADVAGMTSRGPLVLLPLFPPISAPIKRSGSQCKPGGMRVGSATLFLENRREIPDETRGTHCPSNHACVSVEVVQFPDTLTWRMIKKFSAVHNAQRNGTRPRADCDIREAVDTIQVTPSPKGK